MFTFIKKTADAPSAPWEKLAAGRTIKIALPELAAILAVCRGDRPMWKTYHKFNGDGTPIEVRHERGKGEGDAEAVVFAVGGYTRPVAWPELAALKDLLEHVFGEKISYATGPGEASNKNESEEPVSASTETEEMHEERVAPPPTVAVPIPAEEGKSNAGSDGLPARAASVPRVTPKAVCVANGLGATIWIPKSALAEGVNAPENPIEGAWAFAVKSWFARKDEFQAWASGE